MPLRVKNIQDNADLLAALNICPDDPRLLQWVDAFEYEALPWGRWWGTTQLAQFCLTDSGCVVLPRQIATIEAANMGARHMGMKNGWYEFVKPHDLCELSTCSQSGCGCGCGAVNIVEAGRVASFRTTTGTNKKLRVYPSQAADVGKKIIFQGNDSNGIWVRTSIDGIIQDGEQVTLALPFVDTMTTWGSGAPYAVMKEATSYRVLVYSVDQDNDAEVQLAIYEPTETEPSYRRINLPGFCSSTDNPACCGSLLAIVSLDKIPVTGANDWLLFNNPQAYRYGLMAQKYRSEGNIALADSYFFGLPRPAKAIRGPLRHSDGMGALPILRAELRKFTSDVTSINVQTDGLNLANFR